MWAEFTKFDSMSKSYKNILNYNCDDYESGLNFQIFAICLFLVAQWAAKSWIIANPVEFPYI